MSLEKIPRSVLVLIASVGILAMGVLISTARADLDKFKSIAYKAHNISEENQGDIQELKVAVDGVKVSLETSRKEYREDRNKDADLLRAMEDRIIRAVKS